MILARVVGTVVATRKDPRLEGKKLLVLKPVSPEGKDETGYVVAVDTVGACAAVLKLRICPFDVPAVFVAATRK